MMQNFTVNDPPFDTPEHVLEEYTLLAAADCSDLLVCSHVAAMIRQRSDGCCQLMVWTSPVEWWVLLKCPRSKYRQGLGCSPPLIVLPPVIWLRSRVRFIPSRLSNSSTQNRPTKEYRLSRVRHSLRRLSRWQCCGRGIHRCKISTAVVAWLATRVCQERRCSYWLISRSTTRSPGPCGCVCHRHIPTSILIPNNRCSSVLPNIGCR